MSEIEHQALLAAAESALQAPSIFNTQPWSWKIDARTLELRADRDRQLAVTDPDGHFLTLSCGVALQHARVALAAIGWRVDVDRFPQPADPDLMAWIRLVEPLPPRPDDVALHQATASRRTDRRPYGDVAVTETELTHLVAAAEREGAHLHPVRPDQMPMLSVAVASAQAAEISNRSYREELARWTNRPLWSRDGVPKGTGVARVPRRVPVRDFGWVPDEGRQMKAGGDRGARYLVVHGSSEAPESWLRAGEATSAVLLTAVSLGLAVAPFSDVIEVAHTRELVGGLLDRGERPYLVIRCGHPGDATPIEPAPRRAADDVVRS